MAQLKDLLVAGPSRILGPLYTSGGITGNLTGNASTATKLQTARTIFGKSFDGSADVAGQALVYGNYNSTASSRFVSCGLQIRENGLVGNTKSDIAYAPAIAFHWSNRIAATLLLHSDGNFYFRKQDFTTRATVDANLIGNVSGTATAANKVTNALTIQTNGTTAATFDGSAAKTVNITPANIGAAASSHGKHVPDACTVITDWNSAISTGWYMANGASNAPTTGSWYFGRVIVHTGSYLMQEVYQFTASTDAKAIPKYIRAKKDGTWGAWTEVTVQKKVPSDAVFTDTKVTAVGNHYTPSGGTTTSASGGTLTDIANSSSGVQVVTGVTKDAAGHVTGVTSVALKSTNSNTWRGIQNNLTSDSTTDSLSAAQGKALKALIDGKADSSHTHSYLPLSGGTLTGQLTAPNFISSGAAYGLRVIGGSYGFLVRNDGLDTWFLLTDENNAWGGFNSLRPFRIINSTGLVYMENGLRSSEGRTSGPHTTYSSYMWRNTSAGSSATPVADSTYGSSGAVYLQYS